MASPPGDTMSLRENGHRGVGKGRVAVSTEATLIEPLRPSLTLSEDLGCVYLSGNRVDQDVQCGRRPVVAIWRRDGATARMCERHDRRAQRQMRKHPDSGWTREPV